LPLLRKMWIKVGQQTKILTPPSWNKSFSVFGALNTISGQLLWEIFERENIIIRKIIGTLRNEKGTKIHETITSYLATWK
jgi:hypothetical protein